MKYKLILMLSVMLSIYCFIRAETPTNEEKITTLKIVENWLAKYERISAEIPEDEKNWLFDKYNTQIAEDGSMYIVRYACADSASHASEQKFNQILLYTFNSLEKTNFTLSAKELFESYKLQDAKKYKSKVKYTIHRDSSNDVIYECYNASKSEHTVTRIITNNKKIYQVIYTKHGDFDKILRDKWLNIVSNAVLKPFLQSDKL